MINYELLKPPRMVKHCKINVIFRTCDAVNAVHNVPRPFELDKKTLIKICFKSVWKALEGYNFKIIVLGDNLSEEMKNFFLQFEVEFIEGTFGNDASIRESIKIAKKLPKGEWVYFCEDDYLHQPNSFQKITCLIKEQDSIFPAKIKFKQLLRKRELTLLSFKRYFNRPNLAIHPCDYPDRYLPKYATKNFVFHTSDSHWRQISDTTFTFLIEVNQVIKHQKTLLKSATKANDRYLSKHLYGKSFFFNKLLCVSPIPSLSTHMHEQTMSPIIEWQGLVNDLKKEI